MGSTPRLLADALKKEVPGIRNAARLNEENVRLLFSFGDKSIYASGRYADSSLFSMLTLPFVQGNAGTAFDQLHSIVVTETTARKFFGDTNNNVIGKIIRVDNKEDFIITGVIKDLPPNSTLQFEWLVPFENDPYYSGSLEWGSYGPYTLVELGSGTNPEKINSQIKDFIHRKNEGETKSIFLFPMSDWRLYSEFENGKQTGSGRIKQVNILSLIAWVILLIACINFMNLATANSQKRAKEVGVRKVLGAERKGLVFQFVIEAMLMSAIATMAAILFISITLPAFNVLMQKQLELGLANPVHIVALFVITIICGLLAGSYPSLYLSSFKPAFVLKTIKLNTGSAVMIRKGLVVFQFAVSIVFIISTIVVYLQLQHIKNRKLGFNKENLVEVNLQQDLSKVFPLIKQDLLHTGLVENAALSDHPTIYGGNTDGRFRWEGKPAGKEVSIAFRNVSPEFISTSGMKIMEGRDFRENDPAARSEVIITRSFAKLMGGKSVVGRIIQSARGNDNGSYTSLTIAGVVDDYIYGNMYGQPGPVLFFCKSPEDANLLYIRLKAGINAGEALSKIKAVMKKDNPAYPLEYKFVDDQFNEMFFNEMLTGKVSGIFAILAIIISSLGLFGLAAYTAEQRTKEIGIRKVLGASIATVTTLLSSGFVKLVAVSCIMAFPVAWLLLKNWLQNYEYRITISPLIFLGAGILALLIAILTVSFHAIKAAIANPVKALRTE